MHSLCVAAPPAETGGTESPVLYSGDAAKRVIVWDLRTMAQVLGGRGGWRGSGVLCVLGGGSRSRPRTDLGQVHSFETGDDIVCALARAGPHLFTASFASIKVWKAAAPCDAVHCMRDGLSHWVRALAVSAAEDVLFRFACCIAAASLLRVLSVSVLFIFLSIYLSL